MSINRPIKRRSAKCHKEILKLNRTKFPAANHDQDVPQGPSNILLTWHQNLEEYYAIRRCQNPKHYQTWVYPTQLGSVAVNSRIMNSYSPLGVSFKHIVYVMKSFQAADTRCLSCFRRIVTKRTNTARHTLHFTLHLQIETVALSN